MVTRRTNPSYPDFSYLNHELTPHFDHTLCDSGQLVDLARDVLAAAQQSGVAIKGEFAKLQVLLHQVDPLRALGALHVFDGFRRVSIPAEANFGSDAMLDLLATAICAESEATVLDRLGHEFEAQLIWSIEQTLRRIANHTLKIQIGHGLSEHSGDSSSLMLSMLRMENAFDRMAGFDPHVRRVALAVFARADERVCAKLGFALSDSLRLASLYQHFQMTHIKTMLNAMADFMTVEPSANQDEQIHEAAASMTCFALRSASPLEGDETTRELANHLELDEERVVMLIKSMSTQLGSIEESEIAHDTSVRRRPILQLGSGEWMWARPTDFLHGAMEWAFEVCEAHPQLLKTFHDARQKVAEEMAADLLEEVFGCEYVFRNVTYPDAESDAECDTIVSLPGITMLVETKGGRFTAPARRAAPQRVNKHAKELIEKAASQNQRTANAIRDNKTLKARDGRTVPIDPTDELVPIIAILDRIDPFSTFIGHPNGGGADDRNWIVNLVDLVMLTSVLHTPEEFVAYARQRLEMVRSQVTVFVEADCLGNWCEDRSAKVKDFPVPSGKTVRMVADTSEAMNGYFTQEDLDDIDPDGAPHGRWVSKPSTGIPKQVLAALATQRSTSSSQWVDLVDSVAQVAPESWKPLERLLHALARQGSSRPARHLAKKIKRALNGWTIGEKVVVTLVAPESDTLTLAVVTDQW